MKIRSITYFYRPNSPPEVDLEPARVFIKGARQAFEAAGYEVQTARMATTPFSTYLDANAVDELIEHARQMESASGVCGFEYLSMGPALAEIPASYAAIPPVLQATQNVFFSGHMTTRQGEISLPAVRMCAQVIQQAATISPDGFANLRFTALANVASGSPFFPAAYHAGERPAFALATEAADLAVSAFSQASSLGEARQNLIDSMQAHAQRLTATAKELERQFGVKFSGIDYSLAPFPEVEASLGTAMERLGAPALGKAGGLAAAAFLADTIDRAQFQRTGFSGLMLPVLEDATLAARAAEGSLTLRDLMLYSAVCGTGLDTLPLPGETSASELAAVLLDLAALAHRLDKPLTARLMPIPGKAAGEATNFDFAYFANSRVMEANSDGLSGLLAGDEMIDIKKRPGRA